MDEPHADTAYPQKKGSNDQHKPREQHLFEVLGFSLRGCTKSSYLFHDGFAFGYVRSFLTTGMFRACLLASLLTGALITVGTTLFSEGAALGLATCTVLTTVCCVGAI